MIATYFFRRNQGNSCSNVGEGRAYHQLTVKRQHWYLPRSPFDMPICINLKDIPSKTSIAIAKTMLRAISKDSDETHAAV